MKFAENEFKLAQVQKDGSTYKDHLKLIEERSGKIQEELHYESIPNSCLHVWDWFLQLDSSRSSGMQVNPLTYSDMYAFFKLYNVEPEDWEITLLKQFDRVALKEYNKSTN